MSNSKQSQDWGVYDGPWTYKCATQLPDTEVLPRLRRYLELGERRLPHFLKPMEQLTPTEQLAIVAAVNACASSIFNQCTTVRGQWERTFQPDLRSANNVEKLKKFGKLIKTYPDEGLLPLLERLPSEGKLEEACHILKSVRKLAHVNKNAGRKASLEREREEASEEGPSTKRQRRSPPRTSSPPQMSASLASVINEECKLPPIKMVMGSIVSTNNNEATSSPTPVKEEFHNGTHWVFTPRQSQGSSPVPSQQEAYERQIYDSRTSEASLQMEIMSLRRELHEARSRLAYYEYHYNPHMMQQHKMLVAESYAPGSTMSSERGNTKKGAQAHQNTFAWKHNPNSAKTAKILALPNEGLCPRCTEQIEWRKRYRKYKPLTTLGRCCNCNQKNIKRAYHILCTQCARDLKVCAKCKETKKLVKEIKTKEEIEAEERLADATVKAMSERERRSFFRKLERGQLNGDEEGGANEGDANGLIVSSETGLDDDDKESIESMDEDDGKLEDVEGAEGEAKKEAGEEDEEEEGEAEEEEN
ncbi:hypothetical protein PROFUN_04586 [Planoprotostelium fungivorum]|uniref:Uncharacterized protein n=1 Tax=Planoprotostelium fungivorum TaxID=1890364 RepID=A0A2P6NUB8_9EUKA|nr:hypothetical protein PROFUN_04586 [Planoprotostelium fungivorum]